MADLNNAMYTGAPNKQHYKGALKLRATLFFAVEDKLLKV